MTSLRSTITIIVVYFLIFLVIIPAFLLATGFRLDTLLPVNFERTEWLTGLSTLLVFIGLGFMITSILQIRSQGKGYPISHLPPAELVTTGLYNYLRHPIYLGYTITFGGGAILLESFWSLTFSTALLLIGWIGYAHFYEEPVLIARFGDRYRDYRNATALIFPRKPLYILVRALEPYKVRTCRWLSALANKTILFRKGNFILVTYGLFVSIGTILFAQYMAMLFLEQGVERKHAVLFLFGSAVLTFLFTRIFWWLGHWREMRKQPLFGLRNVGFVSWGGVTGLLIASYIFSAVFEYPVMMITDVCMRGIFLASAIGRIGCLTYGCCYGIRSQTYGVVYENPHAKVIREQVDDRVPRHPTPIYSFLADFCLFILLNIMVYAPLPVGFITATAFLLYPIGRTFIEFFRDGKRYVYGIFTHGHMGCAVMFLSGWLLLFLVYPTVDVYSPQPWSSTMLADSLTILPVTLVIGAVIFLGTAFHWKKIGTW